MQNVHSLHTDIWTYTVSSTGCVIQGCWLEGVWRTGRFCPCALEALPSALLCVCGAQPLTPEVTEREWSSEAVMKAAHSVAQLASHETLLLLQDAFAELVRRKIFEGRRVRGCDGLWTFPFIPVGQGIQSVHRELRFWNLTRLVRRLRIVTAPCEQERRALCHAEQLSDSPAGSDRGGRTSPAMSVLERRRPPPAAHQLLQQVPGQPGGGCALLQEVRGWERSLARRLLPADFVPVQRERPETAAHLASGPLGQQLRLPVRCAHLHHQQPRKGFLLRVFQQSHLACRHRAPRGHRGSAGVAPVRGLRDVPVPEVWSGQVEGPADRGSGHILLRGFQPRRAEGGQKLEAEQKTHRVDTCGLFHDFGHHCVECCCSHMASPDHCRVSAQRDGAEETEMTELVFHIISLCCLYSNCSHSTVDVDEGLENSLMQCFTFGCSLTLTRGYRALR